MHARGHNRCTDAILALSRQGPILIYGEAATGKTLTSLLLAKLLYRAGVVDEIHVITTEPQSTIPAASQILPPSANVHLAHSTFDIIEYLVDNLSAWHKGVVLVVDSLTAPFRFEVGYTPDESVRSLAFVAAMLYRITRLGTIVIAVSQVHEKDDVIEPIAKSILEKYFTIRFRSMRISRKERLMISETNRVIIRLSLHPLPDVQCGD